MLEGLGFTNVLNAGGPAAVEQAKDEEEWPWR